MSGQRARYEKFLGLYRNDNKDFQNVVLLKCEYVLPFLRKIIPKIVFTNLFFICVCSVVCSVGGCGDSITSLLHHQRTQPPHDGRPTLLTTHYSARSLCLLSARRHHQSSPVITSPERSSNEKFPSYYYYYCYYYYFLTYLYLLCLFRYVLFVNYMSKGTTDDCG